MVSCTEYLLLSDVFTIIFFTLMMWEFMFSRWEFMFKMKIIMVVEKRVMVRFMGRGGLNLLILMGNGSEFMQTNMGMRGQ